MKNNYRNNIPILCKSGHYVATGAIIPAQEHFMSNLIRQKLIVALDSIEMPIKHPGHRFLLFLPEGELHEIGLLFHAYLIKKRGFPLIYLGQSVPYADLVSVQGQKPATHIVTTFFNTMPVAYLRDIVEKLAQQYKDTFIIVSGGNAAFLENLRHDNFLLLKHPGSFIELIDGLMGTP
ncbi:MAG: hypothetical protein HC896_13435 [Bacteroidales bacterium]|nr:hypothetical protein [Bacteroidales bacterium]